MIRKIQDRNTLVRLFNEWGVPNPEYWAEQELTSDQDAILAMFCFLRSLQKSLNWYDGRNLQWVSHFMQYSMHEMSDLGVSHKTLNDFTYWIERMAFEVALLRLSGAEIFDDGGEHWPEWIWREVVDVREWIFSDRTLSRIHELFPWVDPDPEGAQVLKHRQWIQRILDETKQDRQEDLVELFRKWGVEDPEYYAEEELEGKYPNLASFRLLRPLQIMLNVFLERPREWMESEMEEPQSPLCPVFKEMLAKHVEPQKIGRLAWMMFQGACSLVLSIEVHGPDLPDFRENFPFWDIVECRKEEGTVKETGRLLHSMDQLFPFHFPHWY